MSPDASLSGAPSHTPPMTEDGSRPQSPPLDPRAAPAEPALARPAWPASPRAEREAKEIKAVLVLVILVSIVTTLVKVLPWYAPLQAFDELSATVAHMLFTTYVVPFEALSVTLLAALIGALHMATRGRS